MNNLEKMTDHRHAAYHGQVISTCISHNTLALHSVLTAAVQTGWRCERCSMAHMHFKASAYVQELAECLGWYYTSKSV